MSVTTVQRRVICRIPVFVLCWSWNTVTRNLSRANYPKDVSSGTLEADYSETWIGRNGKEGMINFSGNWDRSTSENINKGSICN